MKTSLRRAGIGSVVILGVASLAMTWPSWLGGAPEPVVQPMAFSHVTHVQGEELRCKDCHDAETSVRAGNVNVKYCDDCHSEPQGEHPDEPKVREFVAAKREIPWQPVNRNVGHVYFSHRVHVSVAEMECEECHGKVEEWEDIPQLPDPKLHSMDACIECHEEEGATIDCLACH